MRILDIASSGVRAQEVTLANIADNIANINTAGYKKREADFAETLAVNEKEPFSPQLENNPNNVAVGAGVILRSTPLNMEQGTLQSSTNPFDLAISGQGFFQVITPDRQTLFTRTGIFRLETSTSQTGQKTTVIIDPFGNRLKTKPALNIPGEVKEIQVDQEGNVYSMDENGTKKVYGQIILANFTNPEKLVAAGNNLFQTTQEAGNFTEEFPGTNDVGTINAQMLEMSNVNLADEMTALIQAQRAYQLNVRMIQDGDEMWGMANALRR